MEDRENRKIELKKATIMKLLDKLYNTTSLNQETLATEELIKEIKSLPREELISFTTELDVFKKCVLYYRLPINFRLDVEFANSVKVDESLRKKFWKEYKIKLHDQKINPEEEYNKIIMMACTLHVPINVKEIDGNTDEDDLYEDIVKNVTDNDKISIMDGIN